MKLEPIILATLAPFSHRTWGNIMATPTHLVKHKRLYLAVGGKLKHVEKGSTLTLSSKQAKGLGQRVEEISSGKNLDLKTAAEEKAKAKAKANAG